MTLFFDQLVGDLVGSCSLTAEHLKDSWEKTTGRPGSILPAPAGGMNISTDLL